MTKRAAPPKESAVVLVERFEHEKETWLPDARRHTHQRLVLAVWNPRYGGWGLPGGMVEIGETVQGAACRELREETGLHARVQHLQLLFRGPHGIKAQARARRGRASIVNVFVLREHSGVPKEMERGCPVTWLTRAEFLRWSPFALFYRRMFRSAVSGMHDPK